MQVALFIFVVPSAPFTIWLQVSSFRAVYMECIIWTVLQKANEPMMSLDGVKQHMEPHFDLIDQEDIPYLIRHHARKYEWRVSCCTVWRRRRDKT